ncbi:MAG TPA: DNA mismatch endonuclease Vsr [Nitrospirae bacterium]|nr:DNA mismatch endonuclease Vsr [Nitrospirota bacterium]
MPSKADKSAAAKRSEIMRAVRSKDTGPEMIVRKLVHSLGFRYRLHVSTLPGKPDLVFPARKKVIFVHGCFWHGDICPRGKRVPKENREYWVKKIKRNVERDKNNQKLLNELGWDYLIIWEHELKDIEALKQRVIKFLI